MLIVLIETLIVLIETLIVLIEMLMVLMRLLTKECIKILMITLVITLL